MSCISFNIFKRIKPEKPICVICLDSLSNEAITIETCGHSFCIKCLLMWILINNCCPVCRCVIRTNYIKQFKD